MLFVTSLCTAEQRYWRLSIYLSRSIYLSWMDYAFCLIRPQAYPQVILQMAAMINVTMPALFRSPRHGNEQGFKWLGLATDRFILVAYLTDCSHMICVCVLHGMFHFVCVTSIIIKSLYFPFHFPRTLEMLPICHSEISKWWSERKMESGENNEQKCRKSLRLFIQHRTTHLTTRSHNVILIL